MSNIDDIIRTVKKNDIDIPLRIQNRIDYTLRNKRKNINYFRRFALALVSIICTIIGSFGVYAVTGGTIDGVPVLDWLGIKFSDKYEEYKQPVEDQIIVFDNTTVELTSTLCNEGMTILEFNLKLSEEDYKKLKIDENALTDEYLEEQEKNKNGLKKRIILALKPDLSNQELKNINYDDIGVSEEYINLRYEEELSKIEKAIEERKNIKFLPAICLNYEQLGGTYNYDVFNPYMNWYASIYIDDEPYYVRNYEKIEKVSDYEYKIYVLYLIDDDILKGKNDFKIALKNNKLVSFLNWENIAWRNDCQNFARDIDSQIDGMPTAYAIDLPSEFIVNVSKNNILQDSIVIDNPDVKSEFRNITQTVEKVVVSPVQTIVRINHSATQQSSKAFANRYPGNPNVEHLPLTREYKVYDANDKELSCFSISNKNTLIYSDGTREDYDYHDIPNKKYNNATWERIEYLIIENTDTDYIKIVPMENIMNPVDGVEQDKIDRYGYEMEPLIINIK